MNTFGLVEIAIGVALIWLVFTGKLHDVFAALVAGGKKQ